MPVTLTQLAGRKVPAALDLGDGLVLHVEYYPSRITSKMLRTIAQLEDEAALQQLATQDPDAALDRMDEGANVLCTVLASWEVVSDDGQPLPISREVMTDVLGPLVTWRIVTALLEQIHLGEASGAASSKPSSPTGTKARRGSSRR